MIQLIPQLRILLACQPIDFRNGIDGLAAICKRELEENPFSGTLFVTPSCRKWSVFLFEFCNGHVHLRVKGGMWVAGGSERTASA